MQELFSRSYTEPACMIRAEGMKRDMRVIRAWSQKARSVYSAIAIADHAVHAGLNYPARKDHGDRRRR
jgi:hypothetical protein